MVQESRKEWRPGNWRNEFPIDEISNDSSPAGIQQHTAHRAFESGADAMLEALKATGIHTTQGYMGAYRFALGLTGKSTDKGQLFFIPDEEE